MAPFWMVLVVVTLAGAANDAVLDEPRGTTATGPTPFHFSIVPAAGAADDQYTPRRRKCFTPARVDLLKYIETPTMEG